MFGKNLRTILGLAAIALLAALAGCSEDGNQYQRLVCAVESVNAGNPLISAYLDAGSDRMEGTQDDFLPIDIVPVVFHARPYSSAITLPEDGPNSYFDIVAYDLTWLPGPTCPPELLNYNIVNAPCYARVPAYDEGAVGILIADRSLKEQAWFRALMDDRTLSFAASAVITFYGHESGSDEMIEIPAGLQVTFYGVVVSGN